MMVLALACSVAAAAQNRTNGNLCGPLPVKFKSNEMRERITYREPLRVNETNVWIKPSARLSFSLGVDRNGAVTCIQFFRGHPFFGAVAIESLKHWRFQPLVKSGKIVPYGGLLVLKGAEFLN